MDILLAFAPVLYLLACVSNSRFLRGGTPAAWSAPYVSSTAPTIVKGRAA